MNMREGMRRIGLTAGIAGAVAGIVGSVFTCQDILHVRSEQSEFRTRLSTPFMSKHVKDIAKASETLPAGYVLEDTDFLQTPNEDGVKSIHYGTTSGEKGEHVESVTYLDGTTVYKVPAIAWWEYAMVIVLPLVGFLIPWGAFRGLVWIGSGFSHPKT
jgi:hypothetical protein